MNVALIVAVWAVIIAWFVARRPEARVLERGGEYRVQFRAWWGGWVDVHELDVVGVSRPLVHGTKEAAVQAAKAYLEAKAEERRPRARGVVWRKKG